jgi:hypothetical protein
MYSLSICSLSRSPGLVAGPSQASQDDITTSVQSQVRLNLYYRTILMVLSLEMAVG